MPPDPFSAKTSVICPSTRMDGDAGFGDILRVVCCNSWWHVVPGSSPHSIVSARTVSFAFLMGLV